MNCFRMVFCALFALCVAASGFSLVGESSSASQKVVTVSEQSSASHADDTGWGIAPKNSSVAF